GAMALGKLKTAASLIALALLAAAGGVLAFHALADGKAQVRRDDPPSTATRGASNGARGKPGSDRADPSANNAVPGTAPPVPGAPADAQPPNNAAGPAPGPEQ